MLVKNGARCLNTFVMEKCISINNAINRVCPIRKLTITITGDSRPTIAAPNA